MKEFGYIILLVLQPSWAGFLFRSSPGGDGIQPAGLWGGDVDVYEGGLAKDLFEKGYHELQNNVTHLKSLDLTSFSYDPVTRAVIMEVEDPSSSAKLIAYGSVCEDEGLHLLAGDIKFSHPDHPYMFDEQCSWRCGWNAFAFYDGQVYFVLSAVFGTIPALLKREIQIRRLNQANTGCSPSLYTSQNKSYDILACSELLTSLHVSDYAWPNPVIDVFAGSTMTALKQTPDSSLELYIQLFSKSTGGVHMTLHQITLGDIVTSRQLYSTNVESVYSGQWRVRGLGEIAHREGVLCWTAAEELLCGQLNGESLTDVKTLIASGEAHQAQVCVGSTYPYPKGKVLTGVAISRTTNPFSLYFGCYSEEEGVGGMGLLQISATYAGAKREILNVTSNKKKVYGGTLLLLRDFAKECGHITNSPDPQRSLATSQSLHTLFKPGDVAEIIGNCCGFNSSFTILLPIVILMHLL